MKNFQKVCFRIRHSFSLKDKFRRLWWQIQGAQFGRGTKVPALSINWPHQVQIGAHCQLESGIFFKYDGIWKPGPSIVIGDGSFIGNSCEFNIRKNIHIGNNCLIASGCKFIDHDHSTVIGNRIHARPGIEAPITLEAEVWLGANVVVLKGITIGRGAIVAAGAVVTKSIATNEIWGGVPARKISDRPVSAPQFPR